MLLLLVPLLLLAAALTLLVREPMQFLEINHGRVSWGENWLGRDLRWTVDVQSAFPVPWLYRRLPAEQFEHLSPTPQGELISLEFPSVLGNQRPLITIVDAQSFESKQTLEIPMPRGVTITTARLLNNRFVVLLGERNAYSVDLAERPLNLKALKTAGPFDWMQGVEGQSQFWTIANRSKSTVLELHRFDEEGKFSLRFAQPICASAAEIDVASGQVHYVLPDVSRLESRDLQSGMVTGSQPIADKFRQLTAETIRMGYIIFSDGARYWFWDPIRDVELESLSRQVITWAQYPPREPSSANGLRAKRLAITSQVSPGNFELRVYDLVSGRTTLKQTWFVPTRYTMMEFMDENTLIHADDRCGLTIHLIDIASGQITKTIAPFRWALWGLSVLIFGFVLWALAWLKASVREAGAAWLDICFLATLCLLFLVLRLATIHNATNVGRLPFNYAQGMIIGLTNVSVLWLALGKTRVTLRVLPFIGCCALTMGLLDLFFAPHSRETWDGVSGTILPGLLLLLIYGLLRWLGWALTPTTPQSTHSQSVPEVATTGRRPSIPMRDFFIVSACLAVALVASRGLLPGFGILLEMAPNVLLLAVGLISQVVASYLALTNVVWLRRFSNVLVGILMLTLIGYPVVEFYQAWNWTVLASMVATVARVVVMGMVCTYLFLHAYRWRGWSLMWRSPFTAN